VTDPRNKPAEMAPTFKHTYMSGTVRNWHWASYVHLCAPVTKQYILLPAKGVISLAGKVTVGLVKSNGSQPPIYD